MQDPPPEVAPNLYVEPDSVCQGDTFTLRKNLQQYPPPDWVVKYSFRGVSGPQIDITSTPDGKDHVLTAPSATTSGWQPGQYNVQGYATKVSAAPTASWWAILTSGFDINNAVSSPTFAAAIVATDMQYVIFGTGAAADEYINGSGAGVVVKVRGGPTGPFTVSGYTVGIGAWTTQAVATIGDAWAAASSQMNYGLFVDGGATLSGVWKAERHLIWTGFITVVQNLSSTATSTDLRSHARRTLDLIEATIEGRASNDVLDSQIDNTTFRRLTPDQLTNLHSYYSAKVRSEVAKARAKAGLSTGRNIYCRFTRPA
jgi:hypothetical protein